MILNKPAVGWILVSDKIGNHLRSRRIRESDYRNWASGVGCVRYARTRCLKPQTHPRSSENVNRLAAKPINIQISNHSLIINKNHEFRS